MDGRRLRAKPQESFTEEHQTKLLDDSTTRVSCASRHGARGRTPRDAVFDGAKEVDIKLSSRWRTSDERSRRRCSTGRAARPSTTTSRWRHVHA